MIVYDLLNDYWRARYARVDAWAAAYGDFVTWPLEIKYELNPFDNPMPGEGALPVDKALQIATDYANAQGLKTSDRANATYIDTGRIFQENVPGVYIIFFDVLPDNPRNSTQYTKIYLNAATGDILGHEVEAGNG